MRPLKKVAIPVIAAWAMACGPVALADPVSVAPAAPVTSTKDSVTAAIRASEGGERSVLDAFDADPAREAAVAAKANADRRAALAALGLQPQQGQRPQAAQSPSRQPGGGISEAPNGAQLGKEAANPAPTEPDLLKEAARPLYDEISKTGIADAVRGLKADLKAQLVDDKDKPAADSTTPADGAKTTGKSKEGESANTSSGDSGAFGSSASVEFLPPPRTAAQVEHDRMMAAAGMEKLIADIRPWAITLLVLAGIAMAWRTTLRYLRGLENRRRRRRFAPSTHPRRSQF